MCVCNKCNECYSSGHIRIILLHAFRVSIVAIMNDIMILLRKKNPPCGGLVRRDKNAIVVVLIRYVNTYSIVVVLAPVSNFVFRFFLRFRRVWNFTRSNGTERSPPLPPSSSSLLDRRITISAGFEKRLRECEKTYTEVVWRLLLVV